MPVVRVLRSAAGAIFLLAGLGKLIGERTVALAPMLLPELGGAWFTCATVFESALPGLEVVTGAALVLSVGRRVRNGLACGIAGAFVFVAASIPEGVRCGCFGVLGGFESRGAHRLAAGALLAAVIASSCLELAVARRRGPAGRLGPGADP